MSARSRSVLVLAASAASVAVAGLLVGVAVPASAAAPPGIDAVVVPDLTGYRQAGSGPLTPRLATLAGATSASVGAQAAAVGLPLTGAGSLRRDAAGRVLVDVLVADAPGFAAATAAGLAAIARDDATATVTGWIAPSALRGLAAAKGVRSASEVLTPMTATDPAGTAAAGTADATATATAATLACTPRKDEADVQLKAARARTTYGVDGTGVTVGVLSDTYDRNTADTRSAAQDVASGDLPGTANPCGRTAPVKVVDDTAPSGADEGRAMLQHVHDLAPGATLAFATAFNGLTSFAQNIRKLTNAGARVISDDVTYFAEPFFQAGPVDAAIATAKAAGVSYYSSAANNNTRVAGLDVGSYEAPAFRPSTACSSDGSITCHDFDAGGAVDTNYGYAVPAGGAVALDLQWDEPWYGVTTDYDILLANANGVIVASSAQNNRNTQQPFEFVRWANPGAATSVYAYVVRAAGTGTPRLKTVEFGNGAAISDVEYRTPTGNDIVGPQIFGHNGGADVVSTAAVPYDDATTPEVYSSPGPVTLYHGPVRGTTPAPALAAPQRLAKPDVAATDGAATTFFGQPDGAVFRFYGTSASSPHAAAVAALMRDADPALTPAQVASILRSTATRIPNGTVRRSGAGLVNALAAVQAATP